MRLRATKLAIAAALAVGSLVTSTQPAQAQIAGAIGKPLPSSDLPAGTVVVRVIAGAISAPVVGTEVTLVVNGEPRIARTDAAGRANFPGLPIGATVVAKTNDPENKEIASEEFQTADSGIRVMLTTKPIQGGGGMAGGGGAPFAGGGGMPAARQMSGEPRYDQQFPAGSITVIVTYNNLKMTNGKLADPEPPVGIDVTLVGYTSANAVKVTSAKTDPKGQVVFENLDATGNTTYFAMTQLPRGSGVDRLTTSSMQLDGQSGVKVVLSSEKRDSTDAVIDDLSKVSPQEPATPEADKIRVVVDGAGTTEPVTLFDAATGKKIGSAPTSSGSPDPSNYQANGKFEAKSDLPAGTLDIEVKGGAGQTEDPIGDVDVRIIDANAKDLNAPGMSSKTGDTGTVRMAVAPDKKFKAVITLYGKPLVSQAFQLDKAGGKIALTAHWSEAGRPEAIFNVPTKPGQVVYAELTMQDNDGKDVSFRSAPFSPVAGHGSTIEIGALPRIVFKFHMGAVVDDEYLGVQGEFEVDNYSWSPYSGGPDGILIPLPKHFKGASVDKNDQTDVAVDQGNGFRISRPLGPGRRVFHGVFSLPVDHGNVDWALDLPFGAWDSNLNILQIPGLDVKLPAGVRGGSGRAQNGQAIYSIPDIRIQPNHAMVLGISGLPSVPGWKLWLPRIAGLVVLLTLFAGVVMAVVFGRRRKAVDPNRGDRRARLLDELVEIDRVGKDSKRRDTVLAELEKLWED